jgi:tetratricopeptide (TPR) repeat protein
VLTVQEAIGVTQGSQAATGEAKKRRGGRGYTKLETMFKLDRNAFDGFEYAHAWSFVYFLNTYEGAKHQKNFNRFFKEIYTRAKGIPSEAMGGGFGVKPEDIRAHLLKRIGEKDVEKLEALWIDYIKQIPIEGPTARLKRALSNLRGFKLDEALADFDAAIELGTTDPRAFVGRAKALAFSGAEAKARADLLKALELDPLDADVYYDLSALKVGRLNTRTGRGAGGGGLEVSDGDASKFSDEEAKRWAGLAMELDPENDYYRTWYERFE